MQITTAHMCIVVVANLYTHRLSTRCTSPKHSNASPLEQLSIANNISSRHGCQKPSPIEAGLVVSLILCRLLHLSRVNAYNSHIISIDHPFNPPHLAALKVLLTNIPGSSLRIGCREVDRVESQTDEHHSYLCLAR